MFKRSFRSTDRVDKAATRLKRSNHHHSGSGSGNTVRDPQKLSKLQRSLEETFPGAADGTAPKRSVGCSPIVTLAVGPEGRLFAAHEEVLRQSPFFDHVCRDQAYAAARGSSGSTSSSGGRRISLPDQEPEVFSAVLEYLYKGDYYPRLLQDRQRGSWGLEDAAVRSPDPASSSASPGYHHHRNGRGVAVGPVEATVYVSGADQWLLRDTVVYCAADRFGLEELKRLALRKQGLQSGIDVGTILRSAQYAYAHTPDTDSRLRAHYLALIIRCRQTFKRSGTMQAEMERGGGGSKLFFDLFVAMCNHLDDVVDLSNARTPQTI
ncbi:hypothetical protein GGR56DRAFT_617687 [Xylariaceae sp. FL0804]|nr:hypothetical protein GGR56DRAFT_617687 [Xylariaceae sp. FL0804]